MDWKLIIDTYHALPASDRTSRNVKARLEEHAHFVSEDYVGTVLSATVMGEVLTKEDVCATVKTLNTLIDIGTVGFGASEPGTAEIDYARVLVGTLTSIVGPSAVDLTNALARVVARYREAKEISQQLDYIERMDAIRRLPESDPPF
jgi:hypothetical protein